MRHLALCLVLLACRGDARSSSSSSSSSPPPPPRPGILSEDLRVAQTESKDTEPPADAARPDFNQVVLDLIDEYPAGGGYAWPAPRGTHGTTRDLSLGGERITRGSGGTTHCSGLTFEVFWRALERWPGGTGATGLTPAAARKLLRTWFVPRDLGHGPAEALPAHGLGRRIDRLEDARPGDFVQVWMNDGSGHTLVFLSWTRDAAGRIVGVRHFSSHPATDGIGITERAIGSGRRDIDPAAIHIARVEPPS